MIVIRRLFQKKLSTLMSLFSLSVLSGMFVLFFLLMPEFTASLSGKIFVGVWAIMATLSFFAHGRSIKRRQGRQYIPDFGIRKNERTYKKARSTNFIRGS